MRSRPFTKVEHKCWRQKVNKIAVIFNLNNNRSAPALMPERTSLIPQLPKCQNLQLYFQSADTDQAKNNQSSEKNSPSIQPRGRLYPKYPSLFLKPNIKPYAKYHFHPNLGISFPLSTRKPKQHKKSQSKFSHFPPTTQSSRPPKELPRHPSS